MWIASLVLAVSIAAQPIPLDKAQRAFEEIRLASEGGIDYVRNADDFVALCATEEQARNLFDSLEKFL